MLLLLLWLLLLLFQLVRLLLRCSEFAFRIGLPCKSGVGGGIVAVVPDRLTLCVWSPALEASGNSMLGIKALELFTTKTGLSVF